KIYIKELLEVYRDKRTLFSTILLPLILYPVLFIGVSSLMTRQTIKMEEEIKVIAIENFEAYQDYDNEELSYIVENIQQKFEENNKIRIYNGTTEIDSLLKDGVIHAVIKLDSISFVAPQTYYFEYKYDGSDDKSSIALREIKSIIGDFEKDVLKVRLSKITDLAEDDHFLNPLSQEAKMTNVASTQQMMGMILGRVLPYLLIMLLISGGAVVATDLVAGEKERKTLETLLVSAVSRNEIVLGKFLTIVTASLINVFVNMFSMYFSLRHIMSQAGASMLGADIPLSAFGWIGLSLLPLISLFSALLLIISTYSRNMKEARSYESPILLVSMMLAMVSMFPGFEMNKGLALVPVVNIALLFKEIMLTGINYVHFGITVGSTILLNIIAITMTIKVFASEKVLFRTQTETSFAGLKKNKKQFFNPGIGFVFYLIMIGLLYYVGFGWQQSAVVNGVIDQEALMMAVIKTQVFVIGLPVLLLVNLFFGKGKKGKERAENKTKTRKFLRYQGFKPINLALVPLLTIPTVIISSWITKAVDLFYPIPEDYFAGMMELMTGNQLSLPILILAIAVTPAIFEELLFRGLLPRFFENKGVWKTILITGVLFAIFHLDFYKLLPITFLGSWLGYLLYTSKSIYMPMFAHFLNNLFAIIAAHEIIPTKYVTLIESNSLNSMLILGGSVVLFIVLNIIMYKVNNGFEEIE
ncbi:MAG: ABC transporter permease subunit/CPBP intramembrane protease, partial [Candidatus Cloacimonadales bacterium]